jgi:outer membrane receptor protein involved in Fe transport
VEAVPGVFAVQHAGGGKANQYFLRGFDADHGTDVRISIDGIPANMVSHGHGQGYADLHFLIPELVVELEGYKGAAYAHLGDFATAGAIEMRLAEKLDESYAQVSIGQYGIYRGLAIVSPDLGEDWRLVAAAEIYADDGPFENEEDLIRFNAYGKLTHDLSANAKASLSWMSYGSGWNGSGQIPARAVCGEGEGGAAPPSTFGEPCIDRFGTVDPHEGGATQRHAARLSLDVKWEDADFRAMAYVLRQNFTLYSNFTFFAEDAERGDGIEQNDARWVTGLDARFRKHFHLGKSVFTATAGAQVRYDAIDNALHHQEARERLEPRVDASIGESSLGFYVEADARLTDWLRWVLGARFDRFDVSVEDHLEDLATSGSKTSGVAGDMLFSPKASVTVTPVAPWDLFASFGRGFHSNDARGTVLARDPVDLLTVAKTYEAGTRVRPATGLSFDAAVFLIDLESETVWVGDAGGTEASGATRRYGVEGTARYKFADWFFADAEAVWTRPRYTGNAGNSDAIALAPIFTFTTGVGARPKFGDFTPFVGARLKAIADRPAIEDASLTADGYTTVDLNAGLRWKDLEAAVDIQNLFNVDWREVNFATETRLRFEPDPVLGIHYSPGWPFTAIGRLAYYWR